jgi:hypothetical protein
LDAIRIELGKAPPDLEEKLFAPRFGEGMNGNIFVAGRANAEGGIFAPGKTHSVLEQPEK